MIPSEMDPNLNVTWNFDGANPFGLAFQVHPDSHHHAAPQSDSGPANKRGKHVSGCPGFPQCPQGTESFWKNWSMILNGHIIPGFIISAADHGYKKSCLEMFLSSITLWMTIQRGRLCFA